MYYITDTGRRWNGHNYNLRDKATADNPLINKHFLKLNFRRTEDIIKGIEDGIFPGQVMMNFHPQRWNDSWQKWIRGFIWQNIKNQGKMLLLKSGRG